jgi:hypothetical protein
MSPYYQFYDLVINPECPVGARHIYTSRDEVIRPISAYRARLIWLHSTLSAARFKEAGCTELQGKIKRHKGSQRTYNVPW